GGDLRAGRPLCQRRVRGPLAAFEEARPRGTGSPAGLGAAGGGRNLLRGDRSPHLAGPRCQSSLRSPVHERPPRQAPLQALVEWDRPLNIGTLPVLLGQRVARNLILFLMTAFYVAILVLVIVGALPIPALLALLALPRLRKAWPYLTRPRPRRPPPDFPVWPL